MLNWRIPWAFLTSRLCPPLYRRWRFANFASLAWETLAQVRDIEPELLILPEFLGRPGIFLDVGANNGHYLRAALGRKPAREVMGVEPIPRLSRLLERAFPGVAVHNRALTDKEGDRMLKIPDIGGRLFYTRATLEVDFEEPGEVGRKLIPIAAGTLDAFWNSLGDPQLACVKIDTEGHEEAVLKGGRSVLKRHRPVLLVEIEQRHHQADIAGFMDWIKAFGYDCRYFDRTLPGLRMLEGRAADLQTGRAYTPDFVNNFFFLPQGDAACAEAVERVNRRLAGRGGQAEAAVKATR